MLVVVAAEQCPSGIGKGKGSIFVTLLSKGIFTAKLQSLWQAKANEKFHGRLAMAPPAAITVGNVLEYEWLIIERLARGGYFFSRSATKNRVYSSYLLSTILYLLSLICYLLSSCFYKDL